MDSSVKLCFDCKTSKTPLWRTGPAGPKSLCNACGIRFRKKKGFGGSDKKKEKEDRSPSMSPSPASSTTEDNAVGCRKREIDDGVSVDLRKKMVVLQRPRSPMKKVKRVEETTTFGEVERAAYLLMCLSCG